MIYFASGASAPADLRGLARIGHDLGVALPELSEPVVADLLALAGRHVPTVDGGRLLCVLVDTGAFSEVAIIDGRPVVVRPIGEIAWGARMRRMMAIASALGPQAYCVAPDRVGDQAETLRRLARWARWVRKIRRLGARVVVPIQQGAEAPAAFDRTCAAILGFDDYVRAIPANKDAMPDAVLEAFLRAVRPAAVHFLGLGPRNPRLTTLRELLLRFVPDAAVSCDSNLLAANVGLTNGASGGPRAISAAEHGQFASDAAGPMKLGRSDAIALTMGARLTFERLSRVLAASGVFLRGFERGDDGRWPQGFSRIVPPEQVQMGLFDYERDATPDRK